MAVPSIFVFKSWQAWDSGIVNLQLLACNLKSSLHECGSLSASNAVVEKDSQFRKQLESVGTNHYDTVCIAGNNLIACAIYKVNNELAFYAYYLYNSLTQV